MELKRRTPRKRVACIALLIVPYGIETWGKHALLGVHTAFNRTLWN